MNQTSLSLNDRKHGAFNPSGDAFSNFLRRQFKPEATLAQLIFDVTIGMVLPVLCLVFDPIVFRSGSFGSPLLSRFQLFAYSVIAVEIGALGVWLACGRRVGVWCGVLAGIMYAGVFFSLIVGLFLLPFSVLGLMFIIGLLGFAPFLTAIIYGRNARRARQASGAQLSRGGLFVTFALGATLALGAPAFADWRVGTLVKQSVAQVVGEDNALANDAVRRLRYVNWAAGGELDRIVRAYKEETDPLRKERLARAYQEITGGGDIESRLYVLLD